MEAGWSRPLHSFCEISFLKITLEVRAALITLITGVSALQAEIQRDDKFTPLVGAREVYGGYVIGNVALKKAAPNFAGILALTELCF